MKYIFTLYKVYYRFPYGEDIVYIGRTYQPLTSRLTGHFQGRVMHKPIQKGCVTKVEYATVATKADMFLYEIYYINKFKPPLNCDDKANDELTIMLPELEFKAYEGKYAALFTSNLETEGAK